MHRPLRTSPRIKGFDYVGPLAAHLTFVTRERRPIFDDAELATHCLAALKDARSRSDGRIHAYCLMRDHLHVLIEMPTGKSLQDFAKDFKQLSGFRLKQLTGSSIWQTSYYDHVIRREENLLDLANYIWQNPVKDGLVTERKEYPLSGPRDVLEQA
ncbi:MAG TPA: transposase [Dehalococcoidia bacterium]|nr:transposase [Dehalococcoidia bacterium]